MAAAKNLLETLYAWEQKDPDRRLITQPMGGGDANLKHWTIKETLDEARRMAAHLKSLDYEPGSTIAICSKNCAWWIMADLAIWMAGHVSVPIYPTLTADEVAYILEHSESKLLFVGKLDAVWNIMKEGVPADLPQIAFPLSPDKEHDKWDDIIAANDPIDPAADRQPDELATIIYTSGSTGRPKGVMHDFKTMLVCTEGLQRVIHSGPDERYLSYLPMAHGMERWLGECSTLYTSGHIFFAESLDTFVQDLQRARPTLFVSVPRLWLKFQLGVFKKMPPEKLDRLTRIPILGRFIKKKVLAGLGLDQVRFAGSGSAPIPAEIIQWYRHLGLELLEGYGMTENFNYSHITKPGDSRPGFVGTTYDDVQCKIDEETGEILVKGPGTMRGYYKNPEATAETVTEDGWIRTGDRGSLDEAGRLKITGRVKEIFKTSKGKYVAPAPIENKLLNQLRVELCCVGGTGHPQPSAVVLLSEEARKAADSGAKDEITRELEEHLAAVNGTLAPHEHIQFLALISDEWLPENGFLTPTMKIKRAKIEETYSPRYDEWYASGKKIIWA